MPAHPASPFSSRVDDEPQAVFPVDVLIIPPGAPLVTDERAPQCGRWWVHTQTAVYLVDLDRRLVVRFPAASEGRDVVVDVLAQADDQDDEVEEAEGDERWLVSRLRQDTQPIPLVQLRNLVVGESMVLVLDIRGDGVLTVRPTTPVCRIGPAG